MRTHRKTLWLFLVVYIFLLVYFTLVDNSFGRNILNIKNLNYAALVNYINNSLNLVPFATIKLYIEGLKSNNISLGYFLINIIGNFIMLMPLAFFVPYMIKRVDRFYKFIIFIVVFSISIELLQILFLTGSCDIDDILLNVSGAVIAYLVFKTLNKKEQF